MLDVYPRSKLPAKDQRRFANRLLRLRDHLKGVKDRRYNHQCVVDIEQYTKSGGVAKNGCGTIACAFGHAVVSQKFPNMKLTIRAWHPSPKVSGVDNGYDANAEDIVSVKSNSGKQVNAEKEANKFFGPNSWKHIFDNQSDNYPGFDDSYWSDSRVTRKTVIARIEQFVKESYNTRTIR